jgi:hypothetical protein
MYMPSLAVLSLAATSCVDSAQDAGHEHAAELEDDDFKGCPTDIPVFEPGSRAQGEHFALRVLSALPNEPERYTNTWNVELTALAGKNTKAQITRGRTFMPVHGHDGRVEPSIRPLATVTTSRAIARSLA